MRLRLSGLFFCLCLLFPSLSLADNVVYAFTADYSGGGLPSEVTVQWSFSVPSILTASTTVSSLTTASVSGSLSGCTISSVDVLNPASSTPTLVANFFPLCGPGQIYGGAVALFSQPITNTGTYTPFVHTGAVTGTLTISAPSPSLGDLAAARAMSLLGKPYLEGAKGYDMATKDYNPPFPYVSADTISSGYTHCTIAGCPPSVSTDTTAPGIDCSGLVLWSYDAAAGATTTDTARNPLPRATDEGAGDQYANSTPADPANLKPGDLLFFDYHHPSSDVDHVAMYVGNSEVVEAYYPGWGVLSSTLIPDAQGHTRANYDPFLAKVDLPPCARKPQSAIGWSNVPCFVGYRTPTLSPKYSILFGLHSPAMLSITDPDGITITPNTFFVTDREALREIPGELYYTTDTNGDDEVIGRVLRVGNYFITVIPKPDASPSDTYSLTVTTDAGTINLAQNVFISQIPPLGYGVESTGSAIRPFIPVGIDIKPGSPTNPINLGSNGTTPVAILSNTSFNAPSAVDAGSLTFGRTGTEQSLAFCDSSGEDVNGDGLPDLVCHFYTQKAGFQASDTGGVLQGRTTTGLLIRGTDSIVIVP